MGGGGGGGMRPNTATSRSFAFAFASTTLSNISIQKMTVIPSDHSDCVHFHCRYCF